MRETAIAESICMIGCDMFGCYVHVPFCLSKCYYCDFFSGPQYQRFAEPYITALEQEILQWGERLQHPTLDTLFFGGGTPTFLDSKDLARLLNALRKSFDIAKDAEISIEANPGTITPEKLVALQGEGFNRISIGVQSFNHNDLKTLGRIHSPQDVFVAVSSARQAGWRNINLDLIFGIPGQTIESWKETLKQVAELQPEHISAYSLILEEDTTFWRLAAIGKLNLLPEDLVAEMYEYLVMAMRDAGYLHYEISNFTKPGMECRHNLRYWNYEEYIGLGAGAVSFIDGIRFRKPESLARYIDDVKSGIISISEVEKLSLKTKVSERLMLGLRLIEGISLNDLSCVERDIYDKNIALKFKKYEEADLLAVKPGTLRLTSKGLLLANEVMQSLF